MSAPRVLLVDHFDSFAFLLAEQLARCAAEVRCVRAPVDPEVLARCVAEFEPALVVLSPGPGHPRAATGTVGWLRREPDVAVFGVCLGLQALVVACGGEVDPAPRPVHGKSSRIALTDDPLFDGLPRPLAVARYHSLVATRLPAALEPIAHVRDGDRDLVMAVRHRQRPWLGVQFHPESVLTPHGGALCARALAAAVARTPASETPNALPREHEHEPELR
ncbi:MAG: aminodeoxychorismate/anthranilate synthase component II [Planctomycetes bacterium]|nr:aminodeoxychorismate/anthranilate synthase component II [Planctomycetota bacterium]